MRENIEDSVKKHKTSKNARKEKAVERILQFVAFFSVASVLSIGFFIIIKSIPFFTKYHVIDFLTGTTWNPNKEIFGILPFIIGSIAVTVCSILIAVPIGVGGAVFLAEFAPKWMVKPVTHAIELLAGIPSVIYGFFGLVVLVPILRNIFGGSGFSILAGSIILGIMILPTILSISSDAIHAVPKDYREASLGLGSTQWQMIYKVVLPTAKSGIFTGIVLGVGRAIGETMAMIMIMGNSTRLPESILDPVRSLTGNVVIEMAYAAEGIHSDALYATGLVLFIFIMIINFFVNFKMKKRRAES